MTQPNEKALQAIAAATKAGHNLIMLCDPATLPEMHRLIVSTVQLSSDPGDGDIYLHSTSKKWCLHFQGRLKLANAAGLDWDVRETRPVVMQRDYIHYQAVGFIRKEFGRSVAFRGDVEFDLESLRDDLIDEYRGKALALVKKGDKKKEDVEDYVNYCVNRDFRFKRKHRIKLAATDAKSVVIDKLLNLKAGWSDKKELCKPFLVVRCQVAPDLSDRATQAQLTQMALRAVAGVYGPQLPDPGQQPDVGEVIDVDPCRPIDTDSGEDPPTATTEGDPGPGGNQLPFADLDQHEQLAVLDDLVKRKAYSTDLLPSPIDEFGERNRLRLYDHLMSLPDPYAEDDIPF